MIQHVEFTRMQIGRMIKDQSILFAGNTRLKIYGQLTCASGKRMKKENRVFFTTETEAVLHGFRPCGHCMSAQYNKWKNRS